MNDILAMVCDIPAFMSDISAFMNKIFQQSWMIFRQWCVIFLHSWKTFLQFKNNFPAFMKDIPAFMTDTPAFMNDTPAFKNDIHVCFIFNICYICGISQKHFFKQGPTHLVWLFLKLTIQQHWFFACSAGGEGRGVQLKFCKPPRLAILQERG